VLPAGQTARDSGARIGRYLVTGRIGRGGMGMVYRARDATLERDVAVKTLSAEAADEESRRRFEVEAKAAARLQHPNILTVYEFGHHRGVPFIAMELLPGADLELLLRSGEALLLEEKLEIAAQALRGLAYAHERGIVHRDVKPSNLRVLDDGTVKIMDFGIAKLQGGQALTQSGMMVGTVHYMSPEQIQGQELDGRSDVFSVGVLLYELLAGARPFAGDGASEVLYKIVHQPAPPLPELPGAADLGLAGIVERALAKDRTSRFPSAAAMADALAGVIARLRKAPPPASAAAETLRVSRRLLAEGRPEESLRRLRDVVAAEPGCVEARRALRAALGELRRRERAAEPDDGFPELGVTAQARATRRQPATATFAEPTLAAAPEGRLARPRGAGRNLASAVAACLVLLAAALGVAWSRWGASSTAPLARPAVIEAPAGTAPAARPSPAADVEHARVRVLVDPPGALVALDGTRIGAAPVEIRLDRVASHRLTASLEGHETQELLVPAGEPPRELRLRLPPVAPPGVIQVRSAYPVEVVVKGRTAARGAAPRFSLPAGRQAVSLVAPDVFLRRTTPVEVVAGAEAVLEAPGLGRLNVRATPDNCEVFVDGVSAGYLPILDRPIAAGTHNVAFHWPDGTRRELPVEVQVGRPAFALGRKE
jgi:serine/threonine-protein kinase